MPLADLLAPEFLQAPELLFSDDKYHPSAAGCALAAEQLFPALCNALGEWTGGPVPELPWVSRAAEARTVRSRPAATGQGVAADHGRSGTRRGARDLTRTSYFAPKKA